MSCLTLGSAPLGEEDAGGHPALRTAVSLHVLLSLRRLSRLLRGGVASEYARDLRVMDRSASVSWTSRNRVSGAVYTPRPPRPHRPNLGMIKIELPAIMQHEALFACGGV